MACILVNGEVRCTFTIKDLEKDIRDIFSEDKSIDTFPASIGFKTVIPEKYVSFICSIDKGIINSLHSYKPFSKCLSNG